MYWWADTSKVEMETKGCKIKQYVKIGYSKSGDDRVRYWSNHEGRPIETEMFRVPHFKLAEKLIHQELKGVRQRLVNCPKCTSRHQEWFYEELEHIRRVIRKWSGWLNTHPYHEDSFGSWRLKGMVTVEQIVKLCRPLERVVSLGV